MLLDASIGGLQLILVQIFFGLLISLAYDDLVIPLLGVRGFNLEAPTKSKNIWPDLTL